MADRGLTVEQPHQSEVKLVQRLLAGDQRAFGALVERNMRRAYYVALSLVSSHDDALDLSQEAFARAYRARATLDPERPFYPWYYQILRRLCMNHLRDCAGRAASMKRHTPWLIDVAAERARADRPDVRSDQREFREGLRAAIEALPNAEREVFVLKEFDGLKYREIADLVGIPIGTVMSRLYKARRRLAEALEDHR